MPKNTFFIKLKQDRGARAIAVTILALLLVLSSIILTTVIANRAAKNKDPLPDGSEQIVEFEKTGENMYAVRARAEAMYPVFLLIR